MFVESPRPPKPPGWLFAPLLPARPRAEGVEFRGFQVPRLGCPRFRHRPPWKQKEATCYRKVRGGGRKRREVTAVALSAGRARGPLHVPRRLRSHTPGVAANRESQPQQLEGQRVRLLAGVRSSAGAARPALWPGTPGPEEPLSVPSETLCATVNLSHGAPRGVHCTCFGRAEAACFGGSAHSGGLPQAHAWAFCPTARGRKLRRVFLTPGHCESRPQCPRLAEAVSGLSVLTAGLSVNVLGQEGQTDTFEGRGAVRVRRSPRKQES